MKAFLPLLLLVFPLFLNAQSKTALELSGGTGLSSWVNHPAGYQFRLEPGYQFQIGVSKKSGKSIQYIASIGFVQMNYRFQLNGNALRFGSGYTSQGNYNPNNTGENIHALRTKDRFLCLPVGIRWAFRQNWFWQNSLTCNLLLNNPLSSHVFRVGLNSGLGWQKIFKNDSAVFVLANCRFIFNPAFRGDLKPYNYHPIGFFVEAGIKHPF